MNGADPEEMKQDGLFLANLIQQDIEAGTGYRVSVGVGNVQQRLSDVFLSFGEALTAVNKSSSNPPIDTNSLAQMLQLEQSTVELYLKSGLIKEFDTFFADHLQPLGEAALQSTLIKHYFFADITLTAAQFVMDLGGDTSKVIPEMNDMERFLVTIQTVDEMRDVLRDIFTAVFTFRNNHAQYEKTKLIFEAKDFIDAHFTDPNLLLNDVAATINLSPSHFSVVFGRETGQSFKDYLTRIRIERAKELLRTTNLKCSEIAYQSGYNDPHYFSTVFRKNTGYPPQQFRQLPQVEQ
jgi:two-component system response regulator YesN